MEIIRNKALFKNREDAGKKLAKKLADFKGQNNIVFGLPRGGVPIAREVADYLDAPLDILPVKKITPPDQREFAIGAVSIENTLVLDTDSIKILGINQQDIEQQIAYQRGRINEMSDKFRSSRKLPDLSNKAVILVDDGIATGETLKAAIAAVKQHKNTTEAICVATPVSSASAVSQLNKMGIYTVIYSIQKNLRAIGLYYNDFSQVSDEEVIKFLEPAKVS